MVGQNIGKYRVLDRIGRGGMGTVYRALDETLHRDVAIESRVVGFVDNPHSAAASHFDELEPRNLAGHLKGQTAARAGNRFQRLAFGGIEERFAVRANL